MMHGVKIPKHLKNKVTKWEIDEKTGHLVLNFEAEAGKKLFEIWYYGNWYKTGKQQYLVDTNEAPALIVVKNKETGETFDVFDGGKHGYNAMFVDEYTDRQLEGRILKKLEKSVTKLLITIGNGLDWETEKGEFIDENGETVTLIDGCVMAWDDVVANGFDYFSMSYINEFGKMTEFADFELV